METESKESNILESLVKNGRTEELVIMLEEMPTAEAVQFLEDRPVNEIEDLLDLVEDESRGRLFGDFSNETQKRLFDSIEKRKLAIIFKHLFSEVRADFYQSLSAEEQTEFLPYLDKDIREDIISLSSYPPDTAGGIMSTDFSAIVSDMTVAQALEKLRKDAPSKQMIYYLYVVSDSLKMQGIITLRDLLMAEPTEAVNDLIKEFFVYAMVDEDRESVANKIEKYDLMAIPVLNHYHQLVGIVRHDDALDVIRAEQTEDMEKFMGIVPTETEVGYLETSTMFHFKKRVWWIVALAAIGLISGMIIHHYQAVLEKLIILALYMPMMAATGGNSGSQAATVVIRAVSLGEISDQDWWKIVFKEARISFLLSIFVAGLVFLKIAFASSEMPLPDGTSLSFVAMMISIAIALQVISSAVIGAGLPLVVKRLGGDPAVAASPAITTVVDITGLLIYFSVVTSSIGL